MQDDVAIPECTCGWPQRAVLNEWFPIKFDSEMGEYQLVLDCGDRGKGEAMMRFCPWWGQSLPKSKRGDYFTKPTDKDQQDVRQKLKGVTTVEQMLTALGPPSETHDNPSHVQYTYGDSWDSLVLNVQVRKNLLSYAWHGRYIGSDSASCETTS
jgi:hypothetical protein